jgi:hypothetical protein
MLLQKLEAMGELVSPLTTYKRMLAFTQWKCWCSIQFAKTNIAAYNNPWSKEALTLSKYGATHIFAGEYGEMNAHLIGLDNLTKYTIHRSKTMVPIIDNTPQFNSFIYDMRHILAHVCNHKAS